MPVVDIDSHFFEPFDWIPRRFPELAPNVPGIDPFTILTSTAFGDVLGGLPKAARPVDPIDGLAEPMRTLYRNATPEQREQMVGALAKTIEQVPGAHDPHQRLAWMKEQGVDVQLVLPTFAFSPIARVRREKPELVVHLIQAYNTWACETLDGHADRLIPVGIVDFHHMDEEVAKAELERLRGMGSRSFTFWPTPTHGKSLAHPDFDWIWAASADLGMIPMVHVGAGRPAVDDGWLVNGRPFPGSLATYLAQLHQIPELILTELIVAGVLERNPDLRIFVCELGVDWVAEWLRRLDRGRNFAARMGGEKWPHPLRPSEYASRQVCVSPLEFDPVAETMDALGGDLVVFASDYPHPEGGRDAVARFRGELEGKIDAPRIDRFFGGRAAEALAVGA